MKLISKLSRVLFSIGLSGIIFSSCSFSSKEQEPKKTIIFQSAQNKSFPLDRIMHSLVETYNKNHANNPDFLKVVYQNSEITKVDSEFKLANTISHKIKQKSDNVPNLFLGSISGSSLINQYQRILDVSSDEFFKSQPFIEQINQITKKIVGVNHSNQSALPFDLTDLDVLYFNKPVMLKLFSIFEAGGGIVVKQSKIYNHLITKTALPEDSFWLKLTPKSHDVFKGKTIDDSTFDNLESIFKFSSIIYNGIDFSIATPDANYSILEIDYERNLFTKHLWNKLGNSEETFLWNLKANPKNDKEFAVNFDNFKNEQTREITKKTIQFWYDNIKVFRTKNKFDIRSIKLNNSGKDNFSFNDIRNSNAAFAIGPTVGISQATISKYSIDNFIANKNNKSDLEIIKDAEQKFVKPDDVYWTSQITKIDDSDKYTYQIGGSYLIPISSGDEKVDKATINFIKFLYSYKNSGWINPSDPIIETIEDRSGYFVPLKSNWKAENVRRNNQIKELKKSFDYSKLTNEQKIDLYKNKAQEWDSYYFMQSGLTIRNGIAVLLDNNKTNVSIVDIKNDAKTAKTFKFISDNILNTSVFNSNSITPDKIFELIDKELDK
ncbi:hypothetical protein LNO75_01755 [Mycoplasma sp. T363T]|uniref:Lipoprotein n=1 Tax=Mycoplasma bradburyae TaxID=2963128 RepID=A0ABT5GBU3_9MOLU|nr:hypothetical protein [Mycoplasma bradburyae]MDC4163304.1 hypothetical protein [Mycoplasma bradburyae]MDC4181920.1 hypothetical protein [Mycoplasma bradburyae]MDC4182623.1 hypothetical protein [Mycoplasma bradburyae]UTS70345.1 hypothetical protein NMG68_01225 [Mycoplasma bradburyae]